MHKSEKKKELMKSGNKQEEGLVPATFVTAILWKKYFQFHLPIILVFIFLSTCAVLLYGKLNGFHYEMEWVEIVRHSYTDEYVRYVSISDNGRRIAVLTSSLNQSRRAVHVYVIKTDSERLIPLGSPVHHNSFSDISLSGDGN